jgi:hypothetical protein
MTTFPSMSTWSLKTGNPLVVTKTFLVVKGVFLFITPTKRFLGTVKRVSRVKMAGQQTGIITNLLCFRRMEIMTWRRVPMLATKVTSGKLV